MNPGNLISMPSHYCEGEEHSELLSNKSILFNFDLEHVRKKVACHVYNPEQGVKFMHEQEPINSLHQEQLFACLSRIASGDCENYPIV